MLEPTERAYILRSLAGFARPSQVQQGLLDEFDRKVTLGTIIHYRDNERWSKEVTKIRKDQNKQLENLPICSPYWRMAERMRLIELAKRTKGELSVARGLLMDAAKELGQVEDSRNHGGVKVQVNLLHHVQQLSPAAALRYAETGELPPADWAPDVKVLEAPIQQSRAISGESESPETKVPESSDGKSSDSSKLE